MTHRIYSMAFGSVYSAYVSKVERKGRSLAELQEVIAWLTGYDGDQLAGVIEAGIDVRAFFDRAPQMNPNRALITGTICGVKLAEITDPLMREIRYLDKLVDELAKGRKMDKILRN